MERPNIYLSRNITSVSELYGQRFYIEIVLSYWPSDFQA
jgi:hypothetical protein